MIIIIAFIIIVLYTIVKVNDYIDKKDKNKDGTIPT